MRFVSKIIGLLVILLIILAVIWHFNPLQNAQKRLVQLPLEGPAYLGMDVPLIPSEKDNFKNDDLIKRIYRVGQETAFVYVFDLAYNNSLLQNPMSVFNKQGWKVKEQKDISIPGGVANLVKLTNDCQTKEILYWLSNGSKHYVSPLQNWWLSALRHLSLGMTGDAVILIMIQPVETVSLDWSQLPENFPDIFKL